MEVSTGMEAAELNSKTISTSSVTEEVKQVSSSTSTSINGPKKKPVCFRSGDPHLATSCHHQNAQCHKWGKIGHLVKVCRRAQVPRRRQAQSRQTPSGLKTLLISLKMYWWWDKRTVVLLCGAGYRGKESSV